MTQYPEVFATMKKKISFLDLSADIVRKNMPMTEKDGRGLFKILDPSNVGVIDSIKLKRFAFDGITETPPPSAKPFVKPDLNESVFKICGRHTNLLLDCFSNYDPNTAMEFDEFKRALLSNNLGLNQKDAYNLFLALDGKDGKCNLRILIDNIQPMPVDPACQPSVKPKKPSYIPQSRADRRLRDAIRKCYKQLKQTFEMVDKENTGFVNPNLFCRILNGLVLPLNYEDFRFMMRNVPSDDAGSYNYRYFLALYDPNSAPHELSGVASTTLLADHTFGDSKPMNGSHSPIVRSDSPMQKSASASGMLEGHNSNGAERASAELKRMWQSALRACKAQDSDKSGFVSRSVFTSALETHLGKVMNAEAINSLANSYAMGEDIDYHTCFRTCLNNVMNNGNFITSKSTFQMAPVTKSRPVGATHPWDFKYSKPVLDASVSAIQPSQNNCEKPPYWKRACVQPRSRPSTSAQPMSLDSSVGFNKTAPAALSLEGYEPKIIAVARKVAAHPQYFQFKNELKRAQLVNHRGCVSVRNFNAILAMHNIELSKHELGAVMRVFRSKGMADTITFKDFIDVCAAARAQEV